MDKVKIVLNGPGIRTMLRSQEMQAILQDQAQRISGTESEIEVYVAQTRAVAKVSGDDGNNGLLKAVGK